MLSPIILWLAEVYTLPRSGLATMLPAKEAVKVATQVAKGLDLNQEMHEETQGGNHKVEKCMNWSFDPLPPKKKCFLPFL